MDLVKSRDEEVGELKTMDGLEEVRVCSLHLKEQYFSALLEHKDLAHFREVKFHNEFVSFRSEEVKVV